jgi:hypothetical protein
MMPLDKITVTVGEPNWAPLEHVLPLNDCMNICTWAVRATSSCTSIATRASIST